MRQRVEYQHGKGKVIATKCNHRDYGPCECCGEPCEETWIGKSMREYEPGQFTYHGGVYKFGHRKCVEQAARNALA
jgi:hypothetical protein